LDAKTSLKEKRKKEKNESKQLNDMEREGR